MVETAKRSAKLTQPFVGKVMPLNHRHIDQKTARLFDYRLAKVKGEVVEVSNYYTDGTIVAQHVRAPGKRFFWRGDTSALPLFGQHLWSGVGKRIIVTEGEIDCMTISMLQKNRWPVVSIPNGSNSAAKNIAENMAFLTGYEEVVLCFDNDDAGRAAAEAAAEKLPPGKARIAVTPRKDANEHLMANDTAPLLTALYEARQYQPDGILHISDVHDGMRPAQKIWLFPWDCLTESMMGQRSGEMTLWASGTGSGKSTLIRELAMDHLLAGRKVGMLMLEESPVETMDDMVALLLSKPVRQIRAARQLNSLLVSHGREALGFALTDNLEDDEYDDARKTLSGLPLYIYDHRGTAAFDNILQRIEYMASALECDVIVLDHITALIVGMNHTATEREGIDEVMKNLRSIVERTGVHLDLVSQLNRVMNGKSAEEGGQINLRNLRGSGSLGSVPNNVIAVERHQQAEDPEERRIMRIRVLKGRFTGITGIAGFLRFDPNTRRLLQTEWSMEAGNTFEEERDERPESSDAIEAPADPDDYDPNSDGAECAECDSELDAVAR